MTYEEWEEMNQQREVEKQLIKSKVEEIKSWCKNNLLPTEGLVYNKLEQYIIDDNMFMIWQDRGFISHKFIKFSDAKIKPLKLKHISSCIY